MRTVAPGRTSMVTVSGTSSGVIPSNLCPERPVLVSPPCRQYIPCCMGEGQDTGSSDRERSQRLAKIDALRAAGVEPYPVRFDRDLTLGELRDKYGQLPADSDTGDRVRVAGRLMLIRRQGGLSFAELRDRAGHVQLFVDTHEVGVEKHHTFDHLDRGDI